MGELIYLSERRADRSRPRAGSNGAFFFDLSCPFSYLAAERVERLFGEVDWVPASAPGTRSPGSDSGTARLRAERRAAELRLPLVWPDSYPSAAPSAMRAAAYAAQLGAGSRFALAAMRLAFCGGFDLDDPEIIAEAAAAAGIRLEGCFAAVSDAALDAELRATARGLRVRGLTELPAVRIGKRWFDGERRLVEAAASRRSAAAYTRPLAPVG
jgi:2-hydroxychromene-2-carboxylate isomerase